MPLENLPELLGKRQYPGMSPAESEVTRAWLALHAADYDRVEFNIRLGSGQDIGDEYSEETRALATLLTQKRADLVAWAGTQPTIVEIKGRISFSALGQLTGYRALWLTAQPETPVPLLIAAGNSILSEAAEVFRNFGIGVEVFPDAVPLILPAAQERAPDV